MCAHSCTGQAKVSLKDGAYKRYVFIPSLNWLPASHLHITCELNCLQSSKMLSKGVLNLLPWPPALCVPQNTGATICWAQKMWSGNETIECVPRLPFIEPTGKMWSERWTEGCLVFIACSSGHLTKCTGLIPRSFRWQALGSLHSVFLRGNIQT